MPYRHYSHLHPTSLNSPRIPLKRVSRFGFGIIPCPDCGAGVGEECVTSTGKRNALGHISRRRLANRKLHEES